MSLVASDFADPDRDLVIGDAPQGFSAYRTVSAHTESVRIATSVSIEDAVLHFVHRRHIMTATPGGAPESAPTDLGIETFGLPRDGTAQFPGRIDEHALLGGFAHQTLGKLASNTLAAHLAHDPAFPVHPIRTVSDQGPGIPFIIKEVDPRQPRNHVIHDGLLVPFGEQSVPQCTGGTRCRIQQSQRGLSTPLQNLVDIVPRCSVPRCISRTGGIVTTGPRIIDGPGEC